jgi:hypothetical protein
MQLENELVAIERRLWTNDASSYEVDLAEEALLAFAETGVITKSRAIEEIKRETDEGRRWVDVRLSDVRAMNIGTDSALLAYRVQARWVHETSPVNALASSIYVRRLDTWKLVFHQQTPLDGSDLDDDRAVKTQASGRTASLRPSPAQAMGAFSVGAAAVGALAVGATAVGALAIGRVAIGRLALKRGHVRALTVDDLRIGRLHIAGVGESGR